MSRRTSLPGIDELFGPGGSPSQREPAAAEPDGPRERGEDARDEVSEARAVVRQMAADESDALRAAREAADHLDVPSPELGALLRWAVVVCQARTVVEVGSAAGLSGLWMLEGMPSGGVLTSVEPDADTHRLAADAYKAVSAASRVRSVHGEAGPMLERLADGSYDLVLLQTDPAHYPEYLARARQLLRPGGMLVARGILPIGEHGKALTRFLHDLVEDPGLSATVLPVDGGVAIANRPADG